MAEVRRGDPRWTALSVLAWLAACAVAAPEFAAPVRLGGGAFRVTNYAAPALADFNGDGLLDLALGGGGQAGIHLNRGTAREPRFEQCDVPLPLSAHGSIQALDFNGDGLVDVMIRDRVFLNIGTRGRPAFDADWGKGPHIVRLTCGPLPEGYTQEPRAVLADLNGDGRRDLVVEVFRTVPLYEAHSGRYVVAFDEGHGAEGVFGTPKWLSIRTVRDGRETEYTDHGPYMIFADLDGGEAMPLVGSYGGAVWRLERKGELTWALPASPLLGRQGGGMYSAPGGGDLNGDGLPDLVTGYYDGSVCVAWNRGTRNAPLFGESEILPGGDFRVGEAFTFDVADWDGDGLKDVIAGERVADHVFGAVKVFRNVGKAGAPRFLLDGGVRAEGAPLVSDGIWCHAAPQLVDLNGDREADLLLAARTDDRTPGRCLVFLNRGGLPPKFYRAAPLSEGPLTLKDVTGKAIEVAPGCNTRWADLDGDGLADLVVGGTFVMFHRNLGRPTHPVLSEGRLVSTTQGSKIQGLAAVGDLDGDGLADLVTVTPNGGVLWLHVNRSSPGKLCFEGGLVMAGGKHMTVQEGVFPVICDLDGDGRNELVIGLQKSGELLWLRPIVK